MDARPYVVNVILNTNRKADTLACLESLSRSSYRNQTTIVLDNSSQDGSVEAIGDAFPEVKIVELEKNLGYAGNNNVGVNVALDLGADWVFVLNEDVVLDEQATLRLVEEGLSTDHAAALGPMVYHFDDPHVIQSAGGVLNRAWSASHRAQNETDTGLFRDVERVDWVSGCAILLRREALESIGALDERFFYYWEETEWCVRARTSGWNVLFVPEAKVWHKGVRVEYDPSPNVTYYWARNWLLLLLKYRAPIRAWFATVFLLLRTLFSWSVRPRWKSKREHRDAILQGLWDFTHRRWGMRQVQ